MISLVTFLMVATTVDQAGKISLNYLGTNGLFVSIIIGLLSVEVNRLIDKKNIKLKLPDSIPPMVANFINSLIPLLANIAIFYGFNLIIVSLTKSDFPTFITKCLTPATSLANIFGAIF